MSTVTIKIAGSGTPTNNGNSAFGHMWYSLKNDNGDTKSFGFSPDEHHDGDPFAPGDVNAHGQDDNNYKNTPEKPIYTREIEISQAQYDALMKFGNDPSSGGFDKSKYDGLKNSCVDFVWKAMEVIEKNPNRFEGKLFPKDNIEDVEKIDNTETPPGSEDPTRDLYPELNDLFRDARDLIERRDPLALDLDGDGIETVGITSSHRILFDHDGDGIKTGTGWLTSDDAFLALDRNGNGTIDNGSELFGVDTVLANGQQASNGFAALAELDSNQDGQFSGADTRFADIRLWRDLNQDGLSQSEELHTLAAADIASINLSSRVTSIALAGGNVLSALGSYSKSNGETGALGEFITGSTGNLDLVDNPFYREFADSITLTDQAWALPKMSGAGMVRDLAEAVSLDSSGQLATALSQYAAASTRAEQLAQLDGLIEKWGSTSTMLTSKEVNKTKARYHYWTGNIAPPADFKYESDDTAIEYFAATQPDLYQKITALEQFNGMNILDRRVISLPIPNNSTGVSYVVNLSQGHQDLLNSSWAALSESVYYGLLPQTRLKPYLDRISLRLSQNSIEMDFTALDAALEARHFVDPTNALIDQIELLKFTGTQLLESGWQAMERLDKWIGEAKINGSWEALRASLGASYSGDATSGNDFNLGGKGNDIFNAGAGDDVVVDSEGNDRLYGGGGNDQLFGGAGDDYLEGNDGNDTFVFSRGDGHDTVNLNEAIDTRTETLKLEGINPGDIALSKGIQDGHLTITVKDTGDSVRINNFYSHTNYQIDRIEFGDGTVWNRATLLSQVVGISGTEGGESIYGRNGDQNLLYGLGGNDLLRGGDSTDQLFGGDGNDDLRSGAGNDVLIGGKGDDYLEGNDGNDTFVFSRGDGHDTVNLNEAIDTRTETLKLEGINPGDIALSKGIQDGHLTITVKDTGDSVRINNFYSHTNYQIDRIEFGDGTVWNRATLLSKEVTATGTTDAEGVYGRNGGPNVLDGLGGNDLLRGGDSTDQLFGGDGNDDLRSGAGNDVLIGGKGDDYLEGNDGNDTFVFSRGDGHDTVNLNEAIDTRTETLKLEGINPGDIALSKGIQDGHLTITVKDTGDSVRINNFYSHTNYQIDNIEFGDGTVWNRATLLSQVVMASGTIDSEALYGRSTGPNLLEGLEGDDQLLGGTGIDILEGGAGVDTLTDNTGSGLFNGGAGNDTLSGGGAAEIYLGGLGNDTLTTGAGNDILLFNKGDGQDTLASGGTGSDTLSLGGGIAYSDLTFSKASNDLILKVSATDQITFKDWYAATPSKPVLNLQVMAEAMAGFVQGGTDPLRNQKVETFNFASLAGAFDAARIATPALTSWALTNALANFQLAGSDSAALGGDLAYQYGKNGTLAGIGLTPALDVLSNANLGSTAQTLTPLAGLQTGTQRLS